MSFEFAVKTQVGDVWYRQRGIAGAAGQASSTADREHLRASVLFVVRGQRGDPRTAYLNTASLRTLGRIAAAMELHPKKRPYQCVAVADDVDVDSILPSLLRGRLSLCLVVVLADKTTSKPPLAGSEFGVLTDSPKYRAHVLVTHSLSDLATDAGKKREAWSHLQPAIALLRAHAARQTDDSAETEILP